MNSEKQLATENTETTEKNKWVIQRSYFTRQQVSAGKLRIPALSLCSLWLELRLFQNE